MMKEIKELKKMRYCKVVELSSVPDNVKLISCQWVFKLKYRDGVQ